jgi:hypothetical protein
VCVEGGAFFNAEVDLGGNAICSHSYLICLLLSLDPAYGNTAAARFAVGKSQACQ